MLLILIFLVLGSVLATDDTEVWLHSLEFGKTMNDYIKFSIDMEPLKSSFSACAWIKRSHHATNPMVFSYLSSPTYVSIGSNGYNYVNQDLNLESKFPGQSVWFHYCLSWVPGTMTVYLNGEEIGSCSTPVKELTPGGNIAMGNYASTKQDQFVFGGELHKFNLYSEQLRAPEVEKMFNAGMCSRVEEEYDDIRQLKWEEILLKQRYGTVKDRKITGNECTLSNLENKIDDIQSRINKTVHIWDNLDL
jgi:hypothetical protein